jgi:hypothetical protein
MVVLVVLCMGTHSRGPSGPSVDPTEPADSLLCRPVADLAAGNRAAQFPSVSAHVREALSSHLLAPLLDVVYGYCGREYRFDAVRWERVDFSSQYSGPIDPAGLCVDSRRRRLLLFDASERLLAWHWDTRTLSTVMAHELFISHVHIDPLDGRLLCMHDDQYFGAIDEKQNGATPNARADVNASANAADDDDGDGDAGAGVLFDEKSLSARGAVFRSLIGNAGLPDDAPDEGPGLCVRKRFLTAACVHPRTGDVYLANEQRIRKATRRLAGAADDGDSAGGVVYDVRHFTGLTPEQLSKLTLATLRSPASRNGSLDSAVFSGNVSGLRADSTGRVLYASCSEWGYETLREIDLECGTVRTLLHTPIRHVPEGRPSLEYSSLLLPGSGVLLCTGQGAVSLCAVSIENGRVVFVNPPPTLSRFPTAMAFALLNEEDDIKTGGDASSVVGDCGPTPGHRSPQSGAGSGGGEVNVFVSFDSTDNEGALWLARIPYGWK